MGKKDDILIATKSFVTNVDGRKVRVRGGHTRVRANDPIVKGREGLFAPVEDDVVETTRRAPGEKRTTSKKAAKKATSGSTSADGGEGDGDS